MWKDFIETICKFHVEVMQSKVNICHMEIIWKDNIETTLSMLAFNVETTLKQHSCFAWERTICNVYIFAVMSGS